VTSSVSRRGFLAGAGGALAARGQDIEEVDAYGGWMKHDLGANGRFRITRWREGRWLVTPGGHPFIAVGLTPPATAQPSGIVPHTVDLNLVTGFVAGQLKFPDFYDPEWRREAAEKITASVPLAFEDVYSIGYALSGLLPISPTMESNNWMIAIKAASAEAPSKQAYVAFLREHHGTFAAYSEKRDAPEQAQSFEDLLSLNLAGDDDGTELNPADALFYQRMWFDAAQFLVSEIRQHDPDGIIYSFRFAGPRAWPDPWIEAFLKGVGPHVDAFLPEFSQSDPYRSSVTIIGRLTQKPALVANGMEPEMFSTLLKRPWFLGGAFGQIPEPEAQLARYHELNARKYSLRLEALQSPQ
jgi:hypothetical protein